ncbi:MAG: hypothetical protein EOP50_12370 [Sphingobacteriales bacterium]|nr:MAG: hypothetical protein EOP50_12370 [Sphingobacteriales bacterium]
MSYFDAAQAYNRILLEKNDGSYQRISAYKVIGTQFLFGDRHPGDMFAPGEMAKNIQVSYNTYNQEIGLYTSENPNKALVKEAKNVDSFRLRPKGIANVSEEFVFYNGRVLGAAPNAFYQRMGTGPKYSLFKKYKSVLGVVSANYVDADLRQFDLESEYYFYNGATHELKRIKPNESSVKKAFPQLTTLSELFAEYPPTDNPDLALMQVLNRLND